MKITINTTDHLKSEIKSYIKRSKDEKLTELSKKIGSLPITLTAFYYGIKSLNCRVANKVSLELTNIDVIDHTRNEVNKYLLNGFSINELSKGCKIQVNVINSFMNSDKGMNTGTMDRLIDYLNDLK